MVSIKKVLVVDDDPGIRSLLSDLLSGPTLRVSLAGDGLEAVRLLHRGRFDVVVTDVNMPGMNGIDLLRWMKRNRRRERVVVMSGSSRHDALLGRGMPPIRARFRKPFRTATFMRTMGEVLAEPVRKTGRQAGAKRKGVA
jgi:CheY-like chemotaxis protein